MLQIEEWFRRPQRKTEKKAAPVSRPVTPVLHKTEDPSADKPQAQRSEFEKNEPEKSGMEPFGTDHPEVKDVEEVSPMRAEEAASEPAAVPETAGKETVAEPEAELSPFGGEPEDMFESEDAALKKSRAARPQEQVSLQDSFAETDELEHISEKIGLDVSGMIDMEKEDFLLQQIDEFREKAKQLQQLMQSRETKAKELQGVVDEKEAKANELDSLIHVRRGEADRIMNDVSEKIDEMSVGVRTEMSGLSDAVSREVNGLTMNLTQEINLSTEKTRQAVEAATQNMIDQNTRSLEGLKEQLEQLGQLEQINELSTEMNSQITTLKTDIADKIHAEDVKCYRNIQASMNEQSKMLSEGDEKIRQHIQEQVDSLSLRMCSQSKLAKVSLFFTVMNFLGVIGILVFLILY